MLTMSNILWLLREMSALERIDSIVDYLSWYSDADLRSYLESQGLQLPDQQDSTNSSANLREFVALYLHRMGWFPDNDGYLSQYNTSIARFTRLPNSLISMAGRIIYPDTVDNSATYTEPILNPRDLGQIGTMSLKQRIDLFEIAIQDVLQGRISSQVLWNIVPWLTLEPRELDRVYSYLSQGNLVAALREVRDLSSDGVYE